MSGFESILGKRDDPAKSVIAELVSSAADPDSYRPSIIRPRAQVGFSLVEADGTMHGFMYHTLRHPKHQVRGAEEYLTFTADGLAVVIQGIGLRVIYLALVRHALAELREYDGRPIVDGSTRVIRLAVAESEGEQANKGPNVRLVK